MVSHDCVAFYLLSQEVAKHVKVVQSGQGADEVFAGYHWYPPMGNPDAASLEGSVASYRKAFFDRDSAGVAALVTAGYLADGDPSGQFVTEHFARAGAATGVDRALRLDTTVMLVDDPVKRVDNMTMAWGLEARPQRPAHAAARQRAVADRPAGTVVAAARHNGSRGMTAVDPDESHPARSA
jgi:asparagine synthase (glutamine-hydrolysing)